MKDILDVIKETWITFATKINVQKVVHRRLRSQIATTLLYVPNSNII